ncbi:hypothetical protein CEXT_115711 [Caerostris extrusa]|uniref:Uncharacterized protein n=1 Tax=Caerostris extrusa TaxID=172846 RepID=A0AAV4S0V3_CAEEX|nr:hypothetical protein CEXT_115711 [Caerostris extrusa]
MNSYKAELTKLIIQSTRISSSSSLLVLAHHPVYSYQLIIQSTRINSSSFSLLVSTHHPVYSSTHHPVYSVFEVFCSPSHLPSLPFYSFRFLT